MKENLRAAQKAKKDEFYTQLHDIENELRHYAKHFNGKTVLCNCDDPYESNFFKYFALNFNRLHLKKLVATSYSGSPIAGTQLNLFDNEPAEDRTPYKAVVTTVHDTSGNGGIDMLDVAELFKSGENSITSLKGNGDFRSAECLELLKEADIVVTNPPFSLFREYVTQLLNYKKHFIIIGNQNAITYKEIFPLLMANQIWLGYGFPGNVGFFESNYKDVAKSPTHRDGMIRVSGVMWFTNIDIAKRHESLILVKKYDPCLYPHYDNYDAINVDRTSEIPLDYSGMMGVPITFMDKYSPDQFDIIGIAKSGAGDPKLKTKIYPRQQQIDKKGKVSTVTKLNDAPALKISKPLEGKTYYKVGEVLFAAAYARILIRNRHPEEPRL